MAIYVSSTIRNAYATAILSAIDTGSGTATIKEYTGSPPVTTGGAITSQTLLGTHDLLNPAGTVTSGVLTFLAIADDVSSDATGTLGFVRILDRDGAFVMDITAATSGSQVIIYNSLAIVAGGITRIISLSITVGNA